MIDNIMETMIVKIMVRGKSYDFPARVKISAYCPKCGARRGSLYGGKAYDGSVACFVDCWDNPCGHTDLYNDVYKEAMLNGLNQDLLTYQNIINMKNVEFKQITVDFFDQNFMFDKCRIDFYIYKNVCVLNSNYTLYKTGITLPPSKTIEDYFIWKTDELLEMLCDFKSPYKFNSKKEEKQWNAEYRAILKGCLDAAKVELKKQ